MIALDKMSVEYKTTFIRYMPFIDAIGLGLFDETKGLFTRKTAKLFVFSLSFFPFAVIQFSFFFNFATNDFVVFAQVVPMAVIIFTNFFKLWILIVKRVKLKRLLIEIGELWPFEQQRGIEQANSMSRLLRRNNKLIYLFFTFSVTNMFTYDLIPLVNSVISTLYGEGVYLLPFQLPNNWPLDNFPEYIMAYTYVVISSVPCQLCLYLPVEILLVVFCSNLSILFTVLQLDLRNAIQRRKDESTNRLLYISDQESHDKINLAVKTHQQLLSISRQVSEVFGILLLTHIISSSIMICFFGFLAVTKGTIAGKALYIVTVCNVTFMILILAVAGQILYDASSDVAKAAYQSLWYESDLRVRKSMLFIIMRAQQPAYLSALGYSDMTLNTFSKIMSSAWTYFNLLIQVFEDF